MLKNKAVKLIMFRFTKINLSYCDTPTLASGRMSFATGHLFPTFFTQAFPGFGAPFDTGRDLVSVDVSSAFAALETGLI
jgi:hypothetical protein